MVSLSAIERRLSRSASTELRHLGQEIQAPAAPLVRPSVIAVGGLAAFALTSHFVPKKNAVLKNGLIGASVLSGLAAVWFFYGGK